MGPLGSDRSHHRVTRFATILLLTALVACDDDPTEPTRDPARLRIVNASEVPDIVVRRIGSETILAQDWDAYEATATCVEIPAGEHALVFTESGVDLALAAADFEAGRPYIAVIDVAGTRWRAAILSDDEQASAANNALRFINATATSGDVYVTPPGTAPSPGFLAIGNGSPFALTNADPSYVHRSTEHTQIRLYDPGVTTGTPRVELTLSSVPPSRLATVVLTDPGASSFVAAPCP